MWTLNHDIIYVLNFVLKFMFFATNILMGGVQGADNFIPAKSGGESEEQNWNVLLWKFTSVSNNNRDDWWV